MFLKVFKSPKEENKKKSDILEDKCKQIRKRTKAGWSLVLQELEEADQ